MDYGNLFTRAWHIVWRNKFMFILGFLATLGSGGNFNFSTGSGDFNVTPDFLEDIPIGDEITTVVTQFIPIIIGLTCLLILLGIAFWLIRLTAQAGMIDAAARLEFEKVTFGQAFSAGLSKLGRMVGINIVLYGFFFLLGLIGLGLFAATIGAAVGIAFTGAESDVRGLTGGLGLVGACFGILACLSVPAVIIATVVYPFAQRGAVLEDLGVMASISHGWQIVKSNLAEILILILFFVVIGFVFSAIAAVVFLPIALVMMGPIIFSAMNTGTVGIAEVLFLIGGGVCLGLVAAAFNAILTTFRSTAVTLAYQEFTKKKQLPAWTG